MELYAKSKAKQLSIKEVEALKETLESFLDSLEGILTPKEEQIIIQQIQKIHPIVNSNTNEENTNGSSENKGNDILESANLRGSVLEFTDNGCLVNQAKDIEGGAGIKIEAPGMENKDNAVSVTYNPDCEFVIATVNAQSGVTNVTTGSISDVKKQSEVYLYGEFADTLHFNATKVVIARWE